MYENSITQILENCLIDLESEQEKFLKDPEHLEDFVIGVKEKVLKAGLAYISRTLSDCDAFLCESPLRKAKGWYVDRHDKKTLITSIGAVTFTKTLFRSRDNGKHRYLLDSILGLKPNERLTKDAQAAVLKECVQTSYRKGGENASVSSGISKASVKELVHSLEFPSEHCQAPEAEKNVADYLFIDADEDHVALQFHQRKGDLPFGENGGKINTEMAKLVYVYEGVEPEAPGSRRHRLVNPHYFSGVYKGTKNNNALWDEVYAYIDHHYELDKIKTIYLGGDGGSWIRVCPDRIAGIRGALDQFHLEKYLLKMTRYLSDSGEDARAILRDCIRRGRKQEFRKYAALVLSDAETERRKKMVQDGIDYILNNWAAAMVRISGNGRIPGCSAEGHVSHVLSARMSSRPMGWSRVGVDKMSHLRAYYYNGGDMLTLLRQQPGAQLQRAAGAEEEMMYSCADLLEWERDHEVHDGKYLERIKGSIPSGASKKVWFRNHIWKV